MLNTDEAVNMINTALPGDPLLTELWQRAQAVNADLDNVSSTKHVSQVCELIMG